MVATVALGKPQQAGRPGRVWPTSARLFQARHAGDQSSSRASALIDSFGRLVECW